MAESVTNFTAWRILEGVVGNDLRNLLVTYFDRIIDIVEPFIIVVCEELQGSNAEHEDSVEVDVSDETPLHVFLILD